ncbi:uncharacterized protein EV420DRAFT_1067320 [Desarmillaria tabescens]|uniref:Uncharacterized protein n=1 Tax=Armillaria tabescens TaxID=1929756 RepID=A0AA39JJY2_ARMTA|nr:uncharacterized protein EV420DRAFT_1067320 [Desarmillaria tabescens]KAK0443126.1 hypothetical protein EV420DRAFT_1067320 [Desarmillaria tabescens]
MSACHRAVSSAGTTLGLLFAPKATVGLGILIPFNFSSQEETRIAFPPTSRSRAKFCLNPSSPTSTSPSYSTASTCRICAAETVPYQDIGLDCSSSKAAFVDEVATTASKCRGVLDVGVFPTRLGEEPTLSISASGVIYKRYSGLGLGAPPTRNGIRICHSHSGTFPGWGEDDAMLDMSPTSPILQQISSPTSKPKRRTHKHPAGLGLGHPPSSSLCAASPPPSSSQPSPQPSSSPTSLESAGIGMLTSSFSISSDLCRLTSQPPLKLPPRQPQPRPRARFLSSKVPHLTVFKFTKRLLYTIPELSTSSLFQGHQHVIGKEACGKGKGSEGSMVRSFGRTLF